MLRQQRRRRVHVPGLPGQGRQAVGRREPQEEAPAQQDHVHDLPAARARASLREVPLPGRVQPGGAGAQGEPAGSPSAGRNCPKQINAFYLFIFYEKQTNRKYKKAIKNSNKI